MTSALTVVVLTRDEESNIGECLSSLAWAPERVVFDSFSTDCTVQIAEAHGARVLQHEFQDFAAQRNAALEEVDAEWILFVDADERVTPALADEITHALAESSDLGLAGWWIPRHNYMLGHLMRGGGWYPDYQLRLLRRGKSSYAPDRPVHEIVILSGEAGYLENALIHYNYDTLAQFREKTCRYTEYEARMLRDRGVQVHPWTLVTMPLRELWRRYTLLSGYRDHVFGLLFCGLMAWYTFISHWRLLRLGHAPSGRDPTNA